MTASLLILFVKPPVPGSVKTRLGESIGMETAADLYRILVDGILREAEGSDCRVRLCTAGDPDRIPETWIRPGFERTVQEKGDLGFRMKRAIEDGFSTGHCRVLIAGTDIPEWTGEKFEKATEALRTHDAVLIPCEDGGYGLIGFSTPDIPESVFERMPWSTPAVCAETLKRLKAAGLTVATPFSISDIDTLTDLAALHSRLENGKHPAPLLSRLHDRNLGPALAPISVILPVYREPGILHQIRHVKARLPNAEILLCDGETPATTLDIIRRQATETRGLRLLEAPKGRGAQQEAGRRAATGAILLFLHADTKLPETAETEIRQAIFHGHHMGAFRLGIDHPHPHFRRLEKGANWRTRTFGLPYGDQAIFLSAALLESIGGFPDIPLMEDVALCKKIRAKGLRPLLLPSSVTTSARRWKRHGIWKVTFRNLLFLFLYLHGVSPRLLARFY